MTRFFAIAAIVAIAAQGAPQAAPGKKAEGNFRIIPANIGGDAAFAPASSSIETDILNLERLRRDAQLRADWETMQKINAADFTEITATGAIRSGAENSAAMRTGVLKFTAVEYTDQHVHAYGDVAFVTGIANRTGSFQGTEFQQHLRYTRIYVRRDGSWKAVFAQNTRIEPAPK